MAQAAYPFCDPDLPLDLRVQDLVCRLTLEEKISQMNHVSPAIERLGIAPYNWWNECLHGVARAGKATVFPQAIGLGATFDPGLIERVAEAISTEARAKHHAALRAGNHEQYRGLTFWSPNVNIFRDPRWGRGQETYGEDPTLTAEIGKAFVRGLQGSDPVYYKVAACAKHYAVHSGPEALRHEFDAQVSLKDLNETYLPAFEALVNEGVESVMGAYNRTLGEPCCGSELLLDRILRHRWGFQGHVVSDCWAIQDFHQHHKITKDPVESAALAVKHGCDLSCGCAYVHLKEAVDRGLITEQDIDRCVSRLIRAKIRLGLFDPPERVPYASISEDAVCAPEHRELARQAAVQSIVLLKNEGGLLPLGRGASGPKRLFVTGPNAASLDVLLGNYFGMSDSLVSILEGITGAAGAGIGIEYRLGSHVHRAAEGAQDGVTYEAKDSDVAIAVVGLAPMLEGEEGEAIASESKGDRVRAELPESQVEFVRKVKAGGKPLVVILTGGAAMAIPEIVEMADALLLVWYPGEQGGRAVGQVLFGDEQPGGRLPVTFPRSTEQLPPYEDYAMAGRTYKYMTEPPLFPFGFGLSYGSVAYRSASFTGDSLEVTVENTGHRRVSEVLQVYTTALAASFVTPGATLQAFARFELDAGERRAVSIPVGERWFKLVGTDGEWQSVPGAWRITVGACSPGMRGQELGAPEPVDLEITR